MKNLIKENKGIAIIIVIGSLLTLFSNSYFILQEFTQGVVTQFGQPIKQVTDPGFHLKSPWQDVKIVDKRILSWDGYPNQVPTKDKKYISVDTTARWKITDALKFIQAVKDESGASSRLNTILDSATRNVISSNNLVEAVRNSNDIIDRIKKIKNQAKEDSSSDGLNEEVFSDIEVILHGREKLSIQIKEMAENDLENLGIELVDVQFRRISYEKSVEAKVFERMISERQRIAEKIRSIGHGESAKIKGKMQKDLSKIESESYRRVQEIEGEADAIALKTYAKAFSKNPDLYEFLKSMDGYKEVLKSGKEIIISPESEYFKYLQKK